MFLYKSSALVLTLIVLIGNIHDWVKCFIHEFEAGIFIYPLNSLMEFVSDHVVDPQTQYSNSFIGFSKASLPILNLPYQILIFLFIIDQLVHDSFGITFRNIISDI